MSRCLPVWVAVLGLAPPIVGCASRDFVRLEVERSAVALKPAVDHLALDLRDHQARVEGLAVESGEVGRMAEDATRGSIEALGLADAAAGRATDAERLVTLALGRADEAHAVAQDALVAAEQGDERLARQWTRRGRLSVADSVVLRFRADAWTLDREAEALARAVADRLRENPNLVVQLEGYADGIGEPPHNLRLSQLRAEAVRRFLVEQGIEVHRVRAIGLGASRPVADDATSEGRRQNRRVVVRVLEAS